MIHWLQQFIDKWNAGRRAKKPNGTLMDEVEDVSTNPWIYATRDVIEQILLYRGRASGHRVDCESDICKKTGEEVLESKAAEKHDLLEAYREFRPMILDTDSPEQVFGEEDDVDQILEHVGIHGDEHPADDAHDNAVEHEGPEGALEHLAFTAGEAHHGHFVLYG